MKSVEREKKFRGRYLFEMPLLASEGMVPLSISDLMKRRITLLDQKTVRGSSVRPRDYLYCNIDTGDGIAYHPDGKIKVIPNAPQLRKVNPKSKISGGALVLEDGIYESMESAEFTQRDVEGIVNRRLTLDEVLKHPIWKALVDDELLQNYSSIAFHEIRRSYGFYDGMKVLLEKDAPKFPIMRMCNFGGLNWGSGVTGRADIDIDYGVRYGLLIGKKANSDEKEIR